MVFHEYRVPKPVEAMYIDSNTLTGVNIDYDTLYYNPETMTYQSKEQYQENQRLKDELKKKDLELENGKKEKDNSLKSLISYFYKDRK